MDPKLADKSGPPVNDREPQARRGRSGFRQETRSSTLPELLRGCHLFSLAARITPEGTPETQQKGDELPDRRFPARVVPWQDFPKLQEQVWDSIDAEPNFASQPIFASKRELNSVSRRVQPIKCHATLESFEQLTVGSFVEKIVHEMYENESLRKQFFSSAKTSLQRDRNTVESSLFGLGGGIGGESCAFRSEDQFCMYSELFEQRRPLYAIEFKTPNELTLAELASGLKEMDIAQDVINRDEKITFEHHSQHLVAAVITELYDYMISRGVKYAYLFTGEAYLFLHIMDHDPSVVQYFLSVPKIDVDEEETHHLHRTAVAQVLTFTLNILVDGPPSQAWYEAVTKRPRWKVKYLNVLESVPESIRMDPPFYDCEPSPWQSSRSSLTYKPDSGTPGECAAGKNRADVAFFSTLSTLGTTTRSSDCSFEKRGSGSREGAPRPFCTMRCIQGLASGGPLDPNCPNVLEHGSEEHPLTATQFMDELHEQLLQDREKDFEQLHVCGAICFLLKASLSAFGYTVLIKATMECNSNRIQHEHKMYNFLRSLQGQHIPVCLGIFSPKIPYFYYSKIMTHMLVLSWAGERIRRPSYELREEFWQKKRAEILSALNDCGVEHLDPAWRNMLWNREVDNIIAIDLEDAQPLSEPQSPKDLEQ